MSIIALIINTTPPPSSPQFLEFWYRLGSGRNFIEEINDAKSGGSNQAMTWPGKQGFAEVSHGGGKWSGLVETITKPPGT